MAIFNSLGSNYNFDYILRSLVSSGTTESLKTLEKFLTQKYGGTTMLYYKGREALTAALQTANLSKDSQIAINGFTCVAVFNAIRTAGFEPVCLDLEKNSNLNFNPETLEKALNSNKKVKAVVVQNTFGYPCDIEKIERICN